MRGSIVVAAVVLAAGIAAADDLPEPPIDCPRGAYRGEDAGPSCRPTGCDTDADCAEGRTCTREDIGLCIIEAGTEEYMIWLATPIEDRGDEPPQAERLAYGECSPEWPCEDERMSCRFERRCIEAPAVSTEPAHRDSGCGTCAAGAGGRTGLWLVSVLSAVVAFTGSRRRLRPSRSRARTRR